MIKSSITSFILLSVLFVGQACQAGQLKGIWLNREGVRAFKEERGTDAHNYFAQSLAEIPFSPEAHFNLGTTYFANKEFDKALKEFEQAASLARAAKNQAAEFASHFNAGVSAGEAKQIDAALDSYQQALAVKPDSVEVKTNIELLTRSQSGGGGEDNKEQKKDEGGKGDQQKQPSDPQQQKPQQKPQPKPFNSKEMSQQDVNRIVEELKRQEEQIRAKFQNEKMKSAPNEKDW